ncbi:SOCS domain-containing protein stops [Arctopsyche grandis]|uniref:SOCS domain-containing protein stops n=1 Tax=Arctopsyche grandis TaxID=121162 RepID=UPI00406D84D8
MEVLMDCYFEEVFKNLDRDCLFSRTKRRELVQYFWTVIAGCAKGETNECDYESSCRHFVLSALRYHEKSRNENGQVCLMGKYHNVLYVAAKLAFDWSLQDNYTVARLLDEIYSCEKTFERLFLGAIFGTTAPHFIAGWKSDFKDKEENVHALVYFLDHATNANLEYKDGDISRRFIDVPLESCGRSPPVRILVQIGGSEMLLILLRFGATLDLENTSTNPVETILDKLKESNRKYPYEMVTCLRVILRVIPTIKLTVDMNEYKNFDYEADYNYQRRTVLEKYSHMLEDHLIPSARCGLRPTELKHLCRCSIRHRLWENFQLPFGIRKLPIPVALQKYIDLCID